MKKYRIIDGHCHVFPDKLAYTATSSTQIFYDIPHTAYYGRLDTLIEQCDENNVEKCVVAMVATSANQSQRLNKFLKDIINKHPQRFIGFGALHPESKTMTEDFDYLLSLGLPGVKLHADMQKCKADSKGNMEIYDFCSQNNLPVLLHTGDTRYDNSNPNRIENILKSFPDLKVIGAHFGGWSCWEEATEKLHKYDNFYVDTCSSFYLLSDTTVKKLINKYGTDKIIFGSDYPIWSQKDELKRLFSLGLEEKQLENILCNNLLSLIKSS